MFDAIGRGDVAAALAQLAADPTLASVRATKDRFFDGLHWLYVGDTPLHLAAAALLPRVVEALLAAGSDVAAVNRRGATALHYACDPRPHGAGVWDPARQVRVIDLLAGAGAPVSLPDAGGATPLHRAVRARGVAAVQCLLSHGADVNARLKKGGSTPMHLALTGSGAGGTAGTADEQQQIIAALRGSR